MRLRPLRIRSRGFEPPVTRTTAIAPPASTHRTRIAARSRRPRISLDPGPTAGRVQWAVGPIFGAGAAHRRSIREIDLPLPRVEQRLHVMALRLAELELRETAA